MDNLPKIVHDRLRATPLPGTAAEHPDADLLTAFTEQALSANEREAVLKHLAFCGDCREIVVLAGPEAKEAAGSLPDANQAETVPVRTKSEGRSLAWPRLRWAALAAGVAVASTIVLLHPGKPSPATSAKQEVSTERQGTAAGQPVPASADSEVASAREKMERPLPPSRALEVDKAAGGQNGAPVPAAPIDDTSESRKRPASADRSESGLFGRPTFGLSTDANAREQQNVSQGRRDVGSLGDLRQAPTPGENSGGGVTALKARPKTFSEEGYRNRPEDRGTDADAARSSRAAAKGAAGENEKDGSEKKDEMTKTVPGAQAQRHTPPVPIPPTHETVTVTSESVGVDTRGAATATPTSDAFAVSKAKQSVGNKVEASMPRADTETSAVAESVTATQVTNSTSGRSFSLVRLLPEWRISAGALERSLNSGVNWQTVFRTDRALLCYASSANDVWAGGKKGALFRSTDGGATWTQISPDQKGYKLSSDVIQIVARSPAEIVVSTSKTETWTTSDGGKTWAKK